MSTLIAVAYPDQETAEAVRRELIEATKEKMLELEDCVVVSHGADGKIKLHQAVSTAGAGAAGGALWGGLIGLIFLAPMVGMAIGAAAGGAGGAMSDIGVDDSFLKDLGAKLTPGSAAVIALGRSEAGDKVIARIKPFGGDVIQSNLDDDKEAHIREALAASSGAPA